MFRWRKKAHKGLRQTEAVESATTSDEVESYYDLDREERRELLRALLEGMSPNPEGRQAANETKQMFKDRYEKSDDD
jgi:hypothetical protein